MSGDLKLNCIRLVSELLTAQYLELRAASFAEVSKQVDRAAVDHLSQLNEGFVWRQIRVDDFSLDLDRAREHAWRGHEAHPAQRGVDVDHARNVRLVVLERMDID